MTYREIYEQWLNNEDFDSAFIDELRALTDERDIEDRFYKDLSFGTAGMRGVIGAGRNRINKYNIRRASQGYANYLLAKSANASCVIAYDNRRKSDEFAREAASVFAANGIKTYVFEGLRSTPELSFAIRHLATTGGVVITASHNPPEYNGYKVYGDDGAQLMPVEADKVTAAVNAVSDFSDIPYMDYQQAVDNGVVELIGDAVDAAYLVAVKAQIIKPESYQQPMVMTYSPLHGTGGMIIRRLLDELGVADVHYVAAQMEPDSEFSTVRKPNPEEEQAFDESKALGRDVDAELLMTTDPDADRVGVMVKSGADYHKLDGNQVGALLTHYVLSATAELPADATIVKTVVTSDLGPKIAADFGVASEETLTGFKFIGDKIKGYQANQSKHFVLGYEESYGYLVGTHARDKDAVVTIMLIVEMAKHYRSQGLSLLDVLDKLYRQYGYHQDKMIAKVLKGKAGMEQMQTIIAAFRQSRAFGDLSIARIDDFKQSESLDVATGQTSTLDFPTSNVLKYYLSDGSWFAIRPSGTEPKLKIYTSVVASSATAAQQKIDDICQVMDDFIDPFMAD